MPTDDSLGSVVGAHELTWSVYVIPAGSIDGDGEPLDPGIYVLGEDVDDEPENGPAVCLTVTANVGQNGADAGEDKSRVMAVRIAQLLNDGDVRIGTYPARGGGSR